VLRNERIRAKRPKRIPAGHQTLMVSHQLSVFS
jgi:hypothetical protein